MTDVPWWQHGVVYQIYPRSFQDSGTDGVGDLEGIRSRLDYLTWLGVDAIWISPIYPSPMADFGYDIADYCDIDPQFGDLRTFDRLVDEAHQRGLRVILDFVPNHTSDQHPWFLESRSGRSSRKRDWFIWRDPAPHGGPPNNWVSNFGGSAWQLDPTSGQYYYHAFLCEQPDLNWRNPAVRRAMYDVLRFWLERGVDGFRVDVIWHLIKDAQFRDNPPNPGYQPGDPDIRRLLQLHSADQPEVHDVIAEMRAVLEEYEDRVLIGEVYLPIERLVAYYGKELAGAHLPFNFQLIQAPWHARQIARIIEDYEKALPEGGWPNWVLGNHDKARIATRVGEAQARVAAMLLLTLRGTPTMYYGDEIGLSDVAIPAGMVRDTWEKNEPGLGIGRDPQRTPMQWDTSLAAGFTKGEPWLPLSADRDQRNVEALSQDPRSILMLYKQLLELRRRRVLHNGSYRPIEAGGDLLAYERGNGRERLVVILNLGREPQKFALPGDTGVARLLLSTELDRREDVHRIVQLRPNEGAIVEPAGSAAD